MQAYINKSSFLNFISDGSSNINYERINNLLVYTSTDVFQLESKEIPAIKYTTKEKAK